MTRVRRIHTDFIQRLSQVTRTWRNYVENDPKSLIEGRDPQLERAVAEVMKKLKDKPVKLPPRPAAPVKTPKP